MAVSKLGGGMNTGMNSPLVFTPVFRTVGVAMVWGLVFIHVFKPIHKLCSPNSARTEGVLTDLVENWWSHATAGRSEVTSQNLVKHNVFGTGG